MEQKILVLVLAIFIYINQTKAQEKAICPVENMPLEKSISCLPQEYIEGEKNFDCMFFSAPENTPVVAPTDGEIQRVSLCYLYNLRKSKSIDLETHESYSEQKTKFENMLQGDVNAKFVNAKISILSKEGITYYMNGFDPEKVFKSGEMVKKGQLLGHMGYAYNKISSPSLRLSASQNGKAIDPMSLFGLKSSFTNVNDYVDYDTKKITTQKLSEALLIVRESLEEGHPGLYDYSAKAKLDSIFETVQNKLTSPLTAEEFRSLLNPLISAIGDSHLSIYGQSRTMPPFPPVMFGLENGQVKTYCATEGYQEFVTKRLLN